MSTAIQNDEVVIAALVEDHTVRDVTESDDADDSQDQAQNDSQTQEPDYDDDDYSWPEPSNVFHKENPEHKEIQNIRKAIQNFLLPDAKANLSLLANKTCTDLYDSYATRCSCGCYDNSNIISSFESADLESMQYIVENKLLHPATLCQILTMLFARTGTLCYPARKIYEAEQIGKNYEKEYAAAHPDEGPICAGWLPLADPLTDYLLDYLCKEHRGLVASWRSAGSYEYAASEVKLDTSNTPTLLHSAFYGHASNDDEERRIRKLLDCDCDPFAYYNFAAKSYDTPFRYMLTHLYHNLAREVMHVKSKEELATLINLVDESDVEYEGRNLIMNAMYRYNHLKKPQWVADLYLTLELIFDLGIDVSWTDKHKRNVSDYIVQYGYSRLLNVDFGDAARSGSHVVKTPGLSRHVVLPAPTGNKPKKSKWQTEYTHNPSPYASMLYRHRFAKTAEEIATLRDEFTALRATLTLDADALNDTGVRHEYESISTLAHNWGMRTILPEIQEILDSFNAQARARREAQTQELDQE